MGEIRVLVTCPGRKRGLVNTVYLDQVSVH